MEIDNRRRRIVGPLKVLTVTPELGIGAIPVDAAATFEEAKGKLGTSRTGVRLPTGSYLRLADDGEAALYQPVRYNEVWNPRIHWIAYEADLRPRRDVYSHEFPIRVGDQTSRQLKAHQDAPSRDDLLWCYRKKKKFEWMLSKGVGLPRKFDPLVMRDLV